MKGVLERGVREAERAGATACDALASEADALEVDVRDGRIEKFQRSQTRSVGIRAFVGRRVAVASGSDLSPEGVSELAETAVRMARLMEEDPAAGLPESAEPIPPDGGEWADPKGGDFSGDRAIRMARELEAFVRGADPRIKTTNGTGVSAWRETLFFIDSRGRFGKSAQTGFSLWSAPVAEADGAMQTGAWGHSAVFLADLEPVEKVGREAVRRTLRKLGARKIPSCKVPVVFEAPAAASLLGHFAGAISGTALYQKTSFLLDALGLRLFPAGVEIVDDPLLPKGQASCRFDGEGTATAPLAVVSDGVLSHYLLDAYSARRLGTSPNGRARRGVGGSPSPGPSNFYLKPGKRSPREVLLGVERGLYVTELMGSGVNPVTGDYSRGAAGHWIEGGEFAHPVQEVTIAGNLKEMFASIREVADDLEFRSPIASPSLAIAEMTVAGQ